MNKPLPDLFRFRSNQRLYTSQGVSATSPPNWYSFVYQLHKQCKSGDLKPDMLLNIVVNLRRLRAHVPRYVWEEVGSVIHEQAPNLPCQVSLRILHSLTVARMITPTQILALCKGIDIQSIPQTWVPSFLAVLGTLSKLIKKNLPSKSSPHLLDEPTRITGLDLPSGFIRSLLDRLGLPSTLVHLNEHHISDVVWGLSQLETSNDWIDDVQQLLSLVDTSDRVTTISSQGLSTIVHAAGHIGIDSPEVIQSYASTLCSPRTVSELDSSGLSSAIVGLGKLRCLGSKQSGYIRTICLELCLRRPIANLSSWDLATVWWGLASVRLWDKELVEALQEEVMKPRRLSTMSEKGLTKVFHGAVKIGVRNNDLFNRILEILLAPSRIGELTLVGGTMLLQSLRKLSEDNQSTWIKDIQLVQSEIWSLDRLNATSIHDMDLILNSVDFSFPSSSSHTLNGVLWRLKMMSSRGYLAFLPGRKLVALVQGLFSLEVSDRAIWKWINKELTQRSLTWQGLNVSSRASLLRCIGGIMGRKLSQMVDMRPFFLSCFQSLKATTKDLRALSGHELMQVIWGLSRGGEHNRDALNAIITAVMEEKHLESMSFSDLKNLLTGVSTLPNVPKEWIKKILDKIFILFDGHPRSLVPILHDLAKIPGVDHGIFRLLLGKLDMKSLSNKHMSIVMQSIGKIRLVHLDLVDDFLKEAESPPRLLSYTDSQFVWVVYSMGRLRRSDTRAYTVLRAFFHDGRINRLPLSLLSVTLYSLARMHYLDHSAIDAIVLKLRGASEFSDLSDIGLVNTFYSLGCLNYPPGDIWTAVLAAISSEKRLDSLLDKGLIGTIFRTIGKLSFANDQVDKTLKYALSEDNLQQLSNSAIVSALYALPNLSCDISTIKDRAVVEMCRMERLSSFHWKHIAEISSRLGSLKLSSKGVHCLPLFLGRLESSLSLGEMEYEWCAEVLKGLVVLSENPLFRWVPTAAFRVFKNDFATNLDTRHLARLITWLSAYKDRLPDLWEVALDEIFKREDVRLCSAKEILKLLCVAFDAAGGVPVFGMNRLVNEAVRIERVNRYSTVEKEKLQAIVEHLGCSEVLLQD